MNRSRSALLLGALLACTACAKPISSWRGLDVSSGLNRVIVAQASARAAFAGVYRSPQLGRLELQQHEDHIDGRFSYHRGTARVEGALLGRFTGNLLQFRWCERHSVPGHAEHTTRKHGSGEFLFDPPLGDQTHPRLFGHRDYLSQLGPPQKNILLRVRVDAGALTATQLSTNSRAADPEPSTCVMSSWCES